MAQNLEHIIWGLSQICNLKRGLQVCHIRLIFSEIYIKDGIKNKILLKIIVSISKTFKTSIFDLASSTRIVSHDGKIFKTKSFFFFLFVSFISLFFVNPLFIFNLSWEKELRFTYWHNLQNTYIPLPFPYINISHNQSARDQNN